MIIDTLLHYSQATGVYSFMNSAWGWPLVESIHFIGLCMLIGCIGVFDLRMLGLGKGIPLAALHKLVPIGVLGFLLNVTSGTLFFVTAPDQYLYNPAFQTKLLSSSLLTEEWMRDNPNMLSTSPRSLNAKCPKVFAQQSNYVLVTS